MHTTKPLILISLLLCPVLIVCAARVPPQTIKPPAVRDNVKRVTSAPRPVWKLEIETDGGLTGRGVGNIRIDSDGRAHATTGADDCARTLLANRVGQVNRMVTRAMPAGWRKAYARADNPRGAADQVRYTLRLTTGGGKGAKVYETYWYDETQGELPSDLRALVAAARASRDELLASCARQGR